MLENLYSFSKNAGHVRAFEYLWGVNPVEKYKTMCPYFWSWVGTIIIIIPLLLLKFFGASISKWAEAYGEWSDKLYEKRRRKFIEKAETIDTTNLKECYNFVKSKCWSKFSYCISRGAFSDKYYDIKGAFYEHEDLLDSRKRERKLAYKKNIESVKAPINSPKDNILGFIIMACISILLALYVFYMMYLGGSWLWEAIMSNWDEVIKTLIIMGEILGLLALAVALAVGIYKLYVEYLSCSEKFIKFCTTLDSFFTKLYNSYLMAFFRGIVKTFVIIGDMIYKTYKKQCPIIYWKEEKN
jgi:hypothetical protein